MSLDRLIEAIKRTGNPSVAGLDPKLEYVPEAIVNKALGEYGQTLEGAAAALIEYNKGLIDALYDIVPAVKDVWLAGYACIGGNHILCEK